MDSEETKVSPESVARSWQLVPAASAGCCRGLGLTMAIFEGRGATDLELASPRDEHVHVLSVELSRVDMDLEVDGQIVHTGRAPSGGLNIVPAGSRPVARVRGAFSVLQLYLPASGLRAVASDLGVCDEEVRGLTLTDPAFAIDRRILALATSLDLRLGEHEEISRLELDHLSLALSEHLIRTWSNVTIPLRKTTGLEPGEQDAILEYLLDSDTPDYHGLSVLLDRPEIEAHLAVLHSMRRSPSDIIQGGGAR